MVPQGHERVVIRGLGADHEQQRIRIRLCGPLVEIGNGTSHSGASRPALRAGVGQNPEIGMCSSKGFRQCGATGNKRRFSNRSVALTAHHRKRGRQDGNQQIALRRQQISGKSSRWSLRRDLGGVGHKKKMADFSGAGRIASCSRSGT